MKGSNNRQNLKKFEDIRKSLPDKLTLFLIIDIIFLPLKNCFLYNIKLFTLNHFNISLKWGRKIALPSFLISVTFQLGKKIEEPTFFFPGFRRGKKVRRREYYESGQKYHSTRTHGEWVEWENTTKMDMHDLTMGIPKISCKDGRINSLFNTV